MEVCPGCHNFDPNDAAMEMLSMESGRIRHFAEVPAGCLRDSAASAQGADCAGPALSPRRKAEGGG